jgi:H+/Cl- antiporter ClcA
MTHVVMVFGGICFGYCVLRSHRDFESWNSRLGWLAVFVAALVAWTVINFLVSKGEIASRPSLPLMQKLFVFLLALWVGWQGFLFGWACRSEPAVANREKNG